MLAGRLKQAQTLMLDSIKPVVFKYRRYDWQVIFANKKFNVCKFSAFQETMRIDPDGDLGIGGGWGIGNPQETDEAKVARSLETHSFDMYATAQAMRRICVGLQEIEDNFGVHQASVGVIAQEIGPMYSFHTPKSSGWECRLFGCNTSIVLKASVGNVPNWFWRKMQFLILGNEWIKNES